MDSMTLVKQHIKEEQFEKEVLSPLSDKIIGEITSNKLTYRQADNLIRLVRDKIENMYVTL